MKLTRVLSLRKKISNSAEYPYSRFNTHPPCRMEHVMRAKQSAHHSVASTSMCLLFYKKGTVNFNKKNILEQTYIWLHT